MNQEPFTVEWLQVPIVERLHVPSPAEEALANLRRSRQSARTVRWLKLVSFNKIANWCARTPGGRNARDEMRRIAVLGELIEASRDGAFGPRDRPTIAYLSEIIPHESWRARVRLLPHQIGGFGPEHVYVQKPAAAQWFADHGYSMPPWLLGVELRRPVVSTIEGHLAPPTLALPAPTGAPNSAPTHPETGQSKASRKRPTQAAVDYWIAEKHRLAFEGGASPPKREAEVFPACAAAIGATDLQMREAMTKVPQAHKRLRGKRDYQIGRADQAPV